MKLKYLLIGLFGISSLLHSFAQSENRIERLIQDNHAIITTSTSNGNVKFIRFPREDRLEIPAVTLPEKVMTFLENYGTAFGIKDAPKELILLKTETDFIGHQHLFFQQKYKGIPVFGGDLRFHFDENDALSAVNGVFIPAIEVSVMPSLNLNEIQNIGLDWVNAQDLNISNSPLEVLSSELYIFQKGLVQGFGGTKHLVYELEIGNNADVLEYVYVDAHKGNVVEQFTGIHTLLSRRLFEANTSTQIWVEGDAFPGALDIWQQNEVETAGQTYYFFENAFAYSSYDGGSAEMQTINNNPSISCPNANWNGNTANYCTGTAADDVVGHEWGHAYTQFTSGLIYAWQAGALNESYSDIWGETIDLLNLYEDAGEDLSTRSACNSSDRWMMGEDASAFGGAIRDMWDPTCKGDPGKVTDGQYVCSSGDSGGVHTNSGVNNHAYALAVDGGTYNGQTITGLGFTKAAHVFWRSQQFYLTNTSGFSEQADALEAACTDLTGINLEGLSTTSTPAGLSGEIITVGDCAELTKVITAVEFRTTPSCGFSPMLAQGPPDLCTGVLLQNNIFSDDFESGIGGWKVSQHPTNPGSWDAHDWTIISSLPGSRAGSAIFGADLIEGDCNTDLENGILRLESPMISIPATATSPVKLAFEHYASMELKWDGGNLKCQVNGGAWNLVPSAAFIFNPYNETLNGGDNDNPMAGEVAYTGADGGVVSGSWGQSQIDLSLLTVPAAAGDDVFFRWELGTDGCNGWDGWYVDDVLLCSCETVLPVNLVVFQAKAKSEAIALNWQTATEQNNLGFELQRSIGLNQNFEPIAWIDGRGTSLQESNYTYTDRAVLGGIDYFYRLRQLDLDGKETFSEIINARIVGENKGDVIISPNPANAFVEFVFTGESRSEVDISILNINGQLVYNTSVLSNQTFGLDVSSFTSGLYLVKFKNDSRIFAKSLLIE